MKNMFWFIVSVALGCMLILSGCSTSNTDNDNSSREQQESFKELLSQSESSSDEDEIPDPEEKIRENADAYYGYYTDVVSVSPADKSSAPSGKEIVKELCNRGFDTDSVITNYDQDGSLSEENTYITDQTTEKYPLYKFRYTSESDVLWTVYVINGNYYAWPAIYNLESEREIPIIISETENIVSFDSTTNRYYETKPHKDVINVIKIDKIDKVTLDQYTAVEMDKL